jgi:hypothetical protein
MSASDAAIIAIVYQIIWRATFVGGTLLGSIGTPAAS